MVDERLVLGVNQGDVVGQGAGEICGAGDGHCGDSDCGNSNCGVVGGNVDEMPVGVSCQECLALGDISEMTPKRWSTTFCEPIKIYKRKGVHHVHDHNVTQVTFRCPAGHVSYQTEARRCWCGWTPV